MPLIKCPRCELNYMDSTDKYCKICYREVYGRDMPDEQELCSICNEAPAMPGRDVCLFCHKEMNEHQDDDMEDNAEDDETDDEELNSVNAMDDISPDIEDELEEGTFDDLSLEELEEREADGPEDEEDG